jgi:hypothetical protein
MDTAGITAALASHAAALGHFERVNEFEPDNAPGNGLSCALWPDRIDPAVGATGLAATTARILYQVRAYSSTLIAPPDAIDAAMLRAVDDLMSAYTGDFTLGGLIKQVDLLGQHGIPLAAQAGYIDQDDRKLRVVTITVPVVVNDAWTQSP